MCVLCVWRKSAACVCLAFFVCPFDLFCISYDLRLEERVRRWFHRSLRCSVGHDNKSGVCDGWIRDLAHACGKVARAWQACFLVGVVSYAVNNGRNTKRFAQYIISPVDL